MGSDACPLRRRALCAAVLLAFAAPAGAVDLIWTTGTFPGGVVPAPEHAGQLSEGEVLQINAGGTKFFNSTLVTLPDSLVFWNSDTLHLQHGTTIVNQEAWHAHSDHTLSFNGGGNTALAYPSFTNQAMFRKAGGTGNTTIGSISFINAGSGVVQADMGTILFSGHIATFESGSTFAGLGTVAIGGNAQFNGEFHSSNLELRSGTITGNAARLASGSARYTGGFLAGAWTLAAGTSFSIGSGTTKFLEAATFTNHGTVGLQDGQVLRFRNGSLFDNRSQFVFEGNGSLSPDAGSGTFRNSGLLRVADGRTASVTLGLGFVNDGGEVNTGAGATLTFGNGSAYFNDNTRFTGPGTVIVNQNAWFNGAITATETTSLRGAATYTGGNAVVHDALEFQGGVLAGTWTLAAGATLFARTTGNKFLDGPDTSAGPGVPETRFTNLGTVRWQAAVPLHMRDGAVLDNRGTFAFEENGSLSLNALSARFENSGTLRVEAGRSASVVGVLNFRNDGGELRAEAGALLSFSGGNAVFNDQTRFTGEGTVRVNHHAWFAGDIHSQNLSLQGSGIYTGTGALLHGTAEFQSGFLDGAWTLAADSTLFGRASGNKFVGAAGGPAASFTNLGTVRWQSTSPLRLRDGALFDNQGTFVFEDNGSLAPDAGSGTFRNTGLFRVADGLSTSLVSLPAGLGFVNEGGEVRVGAGATLNFASGNAHFRDGTRFTGAGRTLVSSHANFSGDIHSANLELNGGQLTGVVSAAGPARLHGLTRFGGGTLFGTWELAADHTFEPTGATNNMFLSGATMVNHGEIRIATANPLRLAQGAQLTNHGTLSLESTGGVTFDAGGGSFVNRGLIRKTAGAGTATIGDFINFNNLGVIEVQSGKLMLPSGFFNNGTLTGSGTLDSLNNSLTNNGRVAPGNSPGVLTVDANFTQTANGVLDIELADLSAYDQLIVQGSATLGGTLALSCVLGCGVEDGDVYTILDSTGNLTGTFASVTTTGFGEGFAYQVIYDATNDWVQLAVIDAGVLAPIPEPETYALMLAGLGLLGFAARRRRKMGTYPI